VRSARFADLTEALCGDVSVDAIVAAFAEPPAEGEVMKRRPAIDRLFAGASIEDIFAALEREAKAGGADAEWAAKIAAIVRGKSPMSLRIALQQMRRGKHWPFEECMQAEFRIVSRIIREHDFYEGVRAVIVDKDNQPRWRPATLAEVTPSMVEAHFAPLDEELPL
jgi:enoyl-CoA hydratase